MAVEVRVPQLGESVVEATVGKWLKKPGDAVSADEPLVELETDKINLEVPATSSGVLQQILHAQGDVVSIDDVLATISEAGEVALATPAVESAPAAVASEASDNGRSKGASPVAIKLAEANGVDLAKVEGSGSGGKVTKEDVETFLKSGAKVATVEAAPKPAPTVVTTPPVRPVPVVETPATALPSLAFGSDSRRVDRVPMKRRRQAIAANLVKAQQTAAMLTTFNEVDMTAIMDIRKRRRDSFKEKNGIGLGFMSFFTKATVGALKAFPLLNAEIEGTDILIKHYYDIGIAVGAEEGLVVPVVRDADTKTFAQIEKSIADLAGRARDNKLALADLQGGTFTITNGGIFGSLMSTPILNYPQVGILGMHKIQERVMVINGEMVIRPMMYLALSYDHRIVDGSEAVRFLVRIKDLLEDPESLLLEG